MEDGRCLLASTKVRTQARLLSVSRASVCQAKLVSTPEGEGNVKIIAELSVISVQPATSNV